MEAKQRAELARACLLPRAWPRGEGPVRELRELASAWQQWQSQRVVLTHTIRGDVSQEGHRLPETCCAHATLWAQRARLPVSAPRKLIIQTVLTRTEALGAAERRLTARRLTIKEPRGALVEPRPASGPRSARVLLRAREDARLFDNQKAVAHDEALTPTIDPSGDVRQLRRSKRDERLEIRRVLLPCAQTVGWMHRHGAKLLQRVFARIARRRGEQITVAALART